MVPDTEFSRTRECVLRFGWNTTCYQIVNPGIRHWHMEDAVVGYVENHGVKVVAGAPVCPEGDLPHVLEAFENGHEVVYVGAEERVYQEALETQRYSISVMGAQPVWSPSSWIKSVDGDASLRAQLNRAKNKEVRVFEWSAEQATRNPDLQRVLVQWLSTRGLPPMHFLVEPDTLGFLNDRRVFVAERKGEVVGFTTLSPIPTRRGWLTEQFVRAKQAPNGTVELLVDSAIRAVEKDGAQMLTMGIVPLSRKAPTNPSDPWWLRFTMGWVRAHGRRFYNFDGLEWFKDKFHPDSWDPIYVISTRRPFPFKHLYALTESFTRIPPWLAILKGAVGAVKQEAAWALSGR